MELSVDVLSMVPSWGQTTFIPSHCWIHKLVPLDGLDLSVVLLFMSSCMDMDCHIFNINIKTPICSSLIDHLKASVFNVSC